MKLSHAGHQQTLRVLCELLQDAAVDTPNKIWLLNAASQLGEGGHTDVPDDLIEVIERDGAAIVDGFVSDTWLAGFNNAIQTSIDAYKPYDYGEPEAQEFLGLQTVRLNGLISKAPNYIDLISDERLLGVMDYFLAPHCGQYRLNSSEIIEIHGGETAQELHWDDVAV